MQRLYSYSIPTASSHQCSINVFNGDLTDVVDDYDIAVCSSFKEDYSPSPNTLIGALKEKKNISVAELSMNPELDFRTMGGWLSHPIKKNGSRIACIEILDYHQRHSERAKDVDDEISLSTSKMLKSCFLTLRYLLEQAYLRNITIRSIALPILGAGHQKIHLEYICIPLIHQVLMMFQSIDTLESVDFFEVLPDRAKRFALTLQDIVEPETIRLPELFISYSSVQTLKAHEMNSALSQCGYSTWIAPESIPTGSNYLTEIARAIDSAKLIILLLTEEAQTSPWVQREIASAVGASKQLLPFQLSPFSVNPVFRFLLDSIQIFPLWRVCDELQNDFILKQVREKRLPAPARMD